MRTIRVASDLVLKDGRLQDDDANNVWALFGPVAWPLVRISYDSLLKMLERLGQRES
jgi:hypothetical protein